MQLSLSGVTQTVTGAFARKGDLRVEVIGNDGIKRFDYCSRQDVMAFEKYRIDPDGVFLTEILDGKGGVRYEPTILFYENSIECVKKGDASSPTPQEAGEAISQAAFSIARLMRRKEDTQNQYLFYVACGTLLVAIAAAYFAYQSMGDTGYIIDLVQNWVLPAVNTAPATPATVPTAVPTVTVPTGQPTLPPRW